MNVCKITVLAMLTKDKVMQNNLYFKMVIIFDDVDNDRLRMKTHLNWF